MADVTLFGAIERVRCGERVISMTVLERRLGYKRKDGVSVPEGVLSYRVLFKPSMRKYISSYFSTGDLVKVKGSFLPYCTNKDGDVKEGYTILGQTIEFGIYPKFNLDVERKMRMPVDSSISEMQPDVDDFMDDDF